MTKIKNMKRVGGAFSTESVEAKPLSNSGGNSTFVLSQPVNILTFFSFFSPILLVISIVSLSFIFQNFKGFIYLIFVLLLSAVRRYVLEYSKAPPLVSDNTICTSIQYSKYGNATFSTFLLGFTLAYLCTPMFVNSSVNWMVFSGLVFYIFFDLGMKSYEGCISFSKNAASIFVDLLVGISLGIGITFAMFTPSLGNGANLFFNETSSTKEICNMPKNQTFKCAVYKNGELVSG
jgi:hypothetical protein